MGAPNWFLRLLRRLPRRQRLPGAFRRAAQRGAGAGAVRRAGAVPRGEAKGGEARGEGEVVKRPGGRGGGAVCVCHFLWR